MRTTLHDHIIYARKVQFKDDESVIVIRSDKEYSIVILLVSKVQFNKDESVIVIQSDKEYSIVVWQHHKKTFVKVFLRGAYDFFIREFRDSNFNSIPKVVDKVIEDSSPFHSFLRDIYNQSNANDFISDQFWLP